MKRVMSHFTKVNALRSTRWVHHSSACKRKTRKTVTYSDILGEESHDAMLDAETDAEYSETLGSREEPYSECTPQLAQNASGSTVSVCLPTVHLPDALEKAIQVVISRHNKKEHVKDGAALSQYLFNRIPIGCEWVKNDNAASTKLKINEHSINNKALRSQYNPNMVWATKPHRAITSDDNRTSKAKKWAPLIRYSKRESLAFLASRAQASYGTALRVLSEVSKMEEGYSPGTLLDFGSGIGTVEWAAHSLWAGSMYEYQCVDISQDMLDLAKSLVLGGVEMADILNCEEQKLEEEIPGVFYRQYLPLSRQVKYDVVVAAHTLGELASVSLRRFTISTLWRKTKDYLVLIEPGTWSGYKLMLEARNMILNSKDWTLFEDESAEDLIGHVVAPCLHDFQCPLMKEKQLNKPCHFAQRVQLSDVEKNSHLKKLNCHIEGFTYLILKKGSRTSSPNSHQVRLIEPARKRSRHFNCRICTSEGKIETCTFTKKKHRDIYKEGRKSKWGDVFSFEKTLESD